MRTNSSIIGKLLYLNKYINQFLNAISVIITQEIRSLSNLSSSDSMSFSGMRLLGDSTGLLICIIVEGGYGIQIPWYMETSSDVGADWIGQWSSKDQVMVLAWRLR